MVKKTFIALSLLIALVLASGVFAEEPGGAPAPGPGVGPGPKGTRGPGLSAGGGIPMRWWDNPQLNLSPQQKTDLEALFKAHQQEMALSRSSLMQKRQEVEALLGQPQLDKGKILAKHKELLTLQSDLEEKRINFEIRQREILTPEQRAIMGSLKPQLRGPRGDINKSAPPHLPPPPPAGDFPPPPPPPPPSQ